MPFIRPNEKQTTRYFAQENSSDNLTQRHISNTISIYTRTRIYLYIFVALHEYFMLGMVHVVHRKNACACFNWCKCSDKCILICICCPMFRSHQLSLVHVGYRGTTISELCSELRASGTAEKHWISHSLQGRGKFCSGGN